VYRLFYYTNLKAIKKWSSLCIADPITLAQREFQNAPGTVGFDFKGAHYFREKLLCQPAASFISSVAAFHLVRTIYTGNSFGSDACVEYKFSRLIWAMLFIV
jgi:hypothetical protein